jgi:hypothetical protein
MTTSQQFRDLSEPTGTFERLFHAVLKTLLPDLADAPWYVREREVVNLFVFRHLIPQFQTEHLDISQLGIEVPVQVSPGSDKGRPSVYADIVVWWHSKATVWRTCKPLARIEWKNISCREQSPANLKRQHRENVRCFHQNWQFASLNYAVLTARQRGSVEVCCTRIVDGVREEMLPVPPCTGTGDESTIIGIGYGPAMSRPQACPDCIALPSAAPVCK